jgi:APA family basic amino acid/polyamine antiporter
MNLHREIGLASATFLVIGNIVGIGIFTTTGLIAEQLHESIWLIGVWILGGSLALIGALCYSQLGILFPKSGGEYAFLRPSYGPFVAFLSGWASLLIGFTAPIAASALGLAHYVSSYLPGVSDESSVGIRLSAITALLAVSLLISVGLKAGNRVHSIVTVVNAILVLAFAVLVLGEAPVRENLVPALGGGITGIGLPALASAIILVMFTYSGWNAAAYVAEEIKSPERNIPRALLLGSACVVVLYTLINLAYLSAVPLSALEGKVAVAEIAAAAVFGDFGRNLVNILILFSILSSLTAMSIAGPRVYFAMSRDGLFLEWLSKVHSTKKIPLRAIWFQTAIAILFIAVGNLYQILLYSGFVLIFFTTLTVSALYRVSQTRFLPTIFIVVNVLILVNATISNPWEALAGAFTVVAGIPVYLYYRNRETGG